MDVHNAFNSILWITIFQEFRFFIDILDQFFPFVEQFYACWSPLYFSQVSQHGDFKVILFKFGTQHRNFLSRVLFILTHFHALHPTVTTHLNVFPSLIDDTHIVGLVSNVVFIFLRLHAKFVTLGFFIQPTKCVVWSPHGLNPSIYHFFQVILQSTHVSIFQVHQWVLCHLWSLLSNRHFKKISTSQLASLFLHIHTQPLKCFHFVMPNTQVIYCIIYFCLQVFCNITPSLIHVP